MKKFIALTLMLALAVAGCSAGVQVNKSCTNPNCPCRGNCPCGPDCECRPNINVDGSVSI